MWFHIDWRLFIRSQRISQENLSVFLPFFGMEWCTLHKSLFYTPTWTQKPQFWQEDPIFVLQKHPNNLLCHIHLDLHCDFLPRSTLPVYTLPTWNPLWVRVLKTTFLGVLCLNIQIWCSVWVHCFLFVQILHTCIVNHRNLLIIL